MKLKNQLITEKLRVFYYENSWNHKEVQVYLAENYNISVCIRTLKYWKKKIKEPTWKHPTITKPPIPPKAVKDKEQRKILKLRKTTGWGAIILKNIFKLECSESTIKRIIKVNGLSRGSKIENQRIHWVKWQRDHPDSLWQMDGHKDEKGNWLLPVIDDCSRYCLGYRKFKTLTTVIVTSYLENLFKIHGVPRELLTDNGVEYGGKSKNSEFDKWCKKWGIKHIRSRIHKPTTTGKIERHHLTYKNEITYCNNDIELFRYRYNQVRPHRSLHMKTPAEVYFDLQIRLNGMEFIHSKW